MKTWITFTATALLALCAQAVEYKTLQTDKSGVTFNYKQMGVAMDGKFRKFSGQISFDPAKPQNGKASLDIDIASVDTGSSEGDQEVVGKTWFNASAHPKASFVASQIKPVAPNQFDVTGKLTIKGQTRDIQFPLKLTPQGNAGVFSGGFVIRRADFGIGEGIWSKFDVVANDIQIHFNLTAQAGK